MPNEDYGLGKLSFTQIKFETSTKTEEIRFSCWGGRFRIGVVKKGEFRPIYEFIASGDKGLVVRRMLEKIAKSSPGTRLPIVFSAWNKDERAWKPAHVLTFGKNDKNVYYVELQWKGSKYEATIKGPAGIALGSDSMSEAERSAYGLDYLIDYVTNTVRLQEILSNKKMEMAPGARGPAPVSGGDGGGNTDGMDLF